MRMMKVVEVMMIKIMMTTLMKTMEDNINSLNLMTY